jgi:multidrug efflux pump
MNISKFFIDRPIFAGVLSVLILLAGLLSVFSCPSPNTRRWCRPRWWCAPSFPAPTPR